MKDLEDYLIDNRTIGLVIIILIVFPAMDLRFSNEFVTHMGFLLAFVILKAQAHGEKAILMKLDELIRAVPEARNELIEIEKKKEK